MMTDIPSKHSEASMQSMPQVNCGNADCADVHNSIPSVETQLLRVGAQFHGCIGAAALTSDMLDNSGYPDENSGPDGTLRRS